MIQQVEDLRGEAGELHRLLTSLRDEDWPRATQFKGWTIDDIVRHLHMGDTLALASASDPAKFAKLMADIQAERQKGLSRIEETRRRLDGIGGSRLLEIWHETLERLCMVLAEKPSDARLKWSGPDMGVRMFTTARQMETWSHAQAIYDLLGVERPAPAPRLRNIAEIGIRTFGWAYRNRGLPVPPLMPSVRLDTPFGEAWQWAGSPGDSVQGDAVGFCQVVTQTRNVADTALSIKGEAALHWMTIVQCFAGPAETPPAPGTRRRSDH
jgi:uncharacterized protein (TIGR03084 family)